MWLWPAHTKIHKTLLALILIFVVPLYGWETSTLIITDDSEIKFDNLYVEDELRQVLLKLCTDTGASKEKSYEWINVMIHESLRPLFYTKQPDIRRLYTVVRNKCIGSSLVPEGCGEAWAQTIITAVTDLADKSEKVLQQAKQRQTRLKKKNKKKTVSYAAAVRYTSSEGEEDEGTLESLPVSTNGTSTSDSELDEFLVTEESVSTTTF
jgi:hypothetical protein